MSCRFYVDMLRSISSRLSYRSFATNRVLLRMMSDEAPASSEASVGTKTKEDTSKAPEAENDEKRMLLAQFNEIEDKYKHCLAETENVRHRLQKQIEDAKVFGIQGFCKDLLEVADILSKANESIQQQQSSSSDAAKQSLRQLHEGLQMTETQLLKVFSRHGLLKISPVEGEKFDPNFHEALFQMPLAAGKVSGTVAAVSKVGYRLHSRTLRPALVGVFGTS